MSKFSVSPTIRKIAATIVLCLMGTYVAATLRGPNGIPALMEKRQEIRALQEQNANLNRELQIKRERIRRLRESQVEQELEIRQRLKLLRPGETSFILPETPKPAGSAKTTP